MLMELDCILRGGLVLMGMYCSGATPTGVGDGVTLVRLQYELGPMGL